MAIGPVHSITVQTAEGQPACFDEDTGELLRAEVEEILLAYLAARLRRSAEADMLDELETGCVVQSVCEDFPAGLLSFWCVEHRDLGAAVASHWYELSRKDRARIEELASTRRCQCGLCSA